MPKKKPRQPSIAEQLTEMTRDRKQWYRSKSYDTVQLLEEAARSEKPTTLSVVTDFLFSRQKQVKLAAQRAVQQIIDNTEIAELPKLAEIDLWGQSYWDCWVDTPGNQLKPPQVKRLAECEDMKTRIAVLGLVSFHHRGRNRHEAVRQLAQIPGPEPLKYLLLRVNDWVPIIAKDATDAVFARFAGTEFEGLLDVMPLVFRLRKQSRRNHTPLIELFWKVLFSQFCGQNLRTSLASVNPRVLREFYRYGLTHAQEHRSRLIASGLNATDPVIRRRCCQYIEDLDDESQIRRHLTELCRDRAMFVRCLALRKLVALQYSDPVKLWQQSLFDESRVIRETARFELRRLGITDELLSNVVFRNFALSGGFGVIGCFGTSGFGLFDLCLVDAVDEFDAFK